MHQAVEIVPGQSQDTTSICIGRAVSPRNNLSLGRCKQTKQTQQTQQTQQTEQTEQTRQTRQTGQDE